LNAAKVNAVAGWMAAGLAAGRHQREGWHVIKNSITLPYTLLAG